MQIIILWAVAIFGAALIMWSIRRWFKTAIHKGIGGKCPKCKQDSLVESLDEGEASCNSYLCDYTTKK